MKLEEQSEITAFAESEKKLAQTKRKVLSESYKYAA